jgi:hypothetical protein
MDSPKTVGQFYVETMRKSMKDATSAEEAGRRYLDELAEVSRGYYAARTATQQAALQTAFQLHNSVIEASQSILDAMTQANRALFEEWAKAATDGQEAIAKAAAAGVSGIEDTIPGGPA